MTDDVLHKNHTTLVSANEIYEICKPLLDFLGANHFAYNRIYLNGSRIRLSTSAEWTEHYFTQKYYDISKFEQDPRLYKSGYYLWDCWIENEQTKDIRRILRDNFNMDHGFAIIKSSEQYMEMYNIAAPTSNISINNIYINNLEVIKKFLQYFIKKSEKLLQQAEQDKIIIPRNGRMTIPNDGSGLMCKDDSVKFLKIIDDFFKINNDDTNVSMSKRECDCLFFLIQGKSAKEIGNILNLSYNTIEFYVKRLKLKFGCHKTTELISKVLSNNYIHNLVYSGTSLNYEK